MKIQKQATIPVGWPSGSLMTPVLLLLNCFPFFSVHLAPCSKDLQVQIALNNILFSGLVALYKEVRGEVIKNCLLHVESPLFSWSCFSYYNMFTCQKIWAIGIASGYDQPHPHLIIATLAISIGKPTIHSFFIHIIA